MRKACWNVFSVLLPLCTGSAALAETMTQAQFERIAIVTRETAASLASANGHSIEFLPLWDDDSLRTVTTRLGEGRFRVRLTGGFARLPEITPDGFALVVCHEIGHIYGGFPYMNQPAKMAAEGQADFWGAGQCLRSVLARLPDFPGDAGMEENGYVENLCQGQFPGRAAETRLCVRSYQAAQSAANALATLKGESYPDLQKKDWVRVFRTIKYAPAKIQCRLDTFRHALQGLDRPLCWFNPEDRD